MKPGFAELVAALSGASAHSIGGRSASGMRAVRVHGYGGAEVVRIEKTAVPEPTTGQVRLRVIASGVNPHDWKLREGYLNDAEPRSVPFTLGSDVSGIVESLGAGVSSLAKGNEVFGTLSAPSAGTFAEYVVAAESDLLRKPSCVSHLEAAALPLSGLAAHALICHGLRPEARVLILGGAGGVGHLAVQLAKTRSAWVAATASRSNLEFVQSLGADLVIERSHPELSTLLDPVDVVIDTVGPTALAPALKVLKRTGQARSIVVVPTVDGGSRDREPLFVSVRSDRAALAELARLLAEGHMRLEIPRVFPLAEVGRALALSQSGHARGKIVLSIYEH